jgi:hypothetical protein
MFLYSSLLIVYSHELSCQYHLNKNGPICIPLGILLWRLPHHVLPRAKVLEAVTQVLSNETKNTLGQTKMILKTKVEGNSPFASFQLGKTWENQVKLYSLSHLERTYFLNLKPMAFMPLEEIKSEFPFHSNFRYLTSGVL